jgi:hypothetical protein
MSILGLEGLTDWFKPKPVQLDARNYQQNLAVLKELLTKVKDRSRLNETVQVIPLQTVVQFYTTLYKSAKTAIDFIRAHARDPEDAFKKGISDLAKRFPIPDTVWKKPDMVSVSLANSGYLDATKLATAFKLMDDYTYLVGQYSSWVDKLSEAVSDKLEDAIPSNYEFYGHYPAVYPHDCLVKTVIPKLVEITGVKLKNLDALSKK